MGSARAPPPTWRGSRCGPCNPRLLTIIRRTITNPMLAAMSMAPNADSSRMLRNEASFCGSTRVVGCGSGARAHG